MKVLRLPLAGLALVLFPLCAPLLQAQVMISEFVADNKNGLLDEDGERPDWLELHNPGTVAVNLAGWSLTDDATLASRWTLPATNLPAGGYLVVFASGKNRGTPGLPLHTSFALAAGGEYLGLLKPDGSVGFEYAPEYPPQETDFSYGLDPQSTNNAAVFFATPTPGAANNSGYVAFVADTKFSVDRGFYEAPFTVEITTATAGATIRYTTNGTRPTANSGLFYTGPITIPGTTVVRAAAFRDGYYPSDVDTHTYLFLNDVIRQSPTGAAPPGWPSSWGQNVVDYGMDPDVVNNQAYSPTIVDDLKSIPSMSIVTELGNLFNASTGIYANPGQDGIAWERPASAELIRPDGKPGFQVNTGLRIRGGYSRQTSNPKHAFRLLFRQTYGDAKLVYPMFARQNGAESFDGFDLRCAQNYSWSFEGDSRHVALRDQFSRDAQYAMGHNAERGDFYHLYINGQYWGLYNSDERPEASYGESYFGGRKEDYDVVKVGDGYNIFATDGNVDAWRRLWRAATNGFASNANYFKVEGRDADGTPNPAYEVLLDVDNLIDYMLVIFFGGNLDAPISNFLGNDSPNNWYGMRNRTGLYGGFRFFAHDSEHTLLDVNVNRIGPYAAGDPTRQGASTAFLKSNPQYLFSRLSANVEFRLRAADHIHKHFFNGGVLTTDGARNLFGQRSNEVYRAMVGESARWGDSKRATPLTRNAEWMSQMRVIGGTFLGQRPNIVLNQLRSASLYPSVAAPSFSQFGGYVAAGYSLSLTAPAGTIYYTLDGSDPRLIGGAVAGSALAYSAPLSVAQSQRVKARTLSNGIWSALADATFYVLGEYGNLAVTELMYNPPGTTNVDGSEYEFLELKNLGAGTLDLSGLRFTNGIEFAFPLGFTLEPGKFAVLAANVEAFTNRYAGVPVRGAFSGKLSNGGETLSLVRADGAPLMSFAYGTRSPWPTAPDGLGYSLVPVNPNLNPDPSNALNWRASAAIGGSPGQDDAPLAVGRILINEVLTHTDPPEVDAVELFNPNETNVNVSGWFLTDQREVPAKFRIPPGSVIPARGYLVFSESQWFADPSSSNSFRLDSHGEQIYLYSADEAGRLTGYSDGFSFGAAQNGVSFGRLVNSAGDVQYPAQRLNTFGATNAGPRIGPVVLNEIQYNPGPGGEEFVELRNITTSALKLYDPAFPTNTWRLNGAGFRFPAQSEIPANGLLLVVNTDPAAFRSKYGVPSSVPVFGPFEGNLQDSGEELALQMPDAPDVDLISGAIYVPYIDVDVVRYNDRSPWPVAADGGGASLEKLDATAYGNDPIAWRASPGTPSPGLENTGNRAPIVDAGLPQSLVSSSYPVVVSLAATGSDDGLPASPGRLTYAWSQVSGPGIAWFANSNQPQTQVFLPGSGTYVFRATADDGALRVSDEVSVETQPVVAPTTYVSRGAAWKYLDTGGAPPAGWNSRTFNDSAWASGPAPLGYGDSPATPVGFGPDANNKYVTTWFRRNFTVSNPAAVQGLALGVMRDDGVAVYINGVGVWTNNLPDTFDHTTYAVSIVGGADETTFQTASLPPTALVTGTNVIAAEVHQVNAGSSDLAFDLELAGEGFPPNLAPVANAGPDQSAGSVATLEGSGNDDGLPLPPGMLTFAWSKASGPGVVTFGRADALRTSAHFSAAGSYTLRLTVSDGELSASDELTLTVSGAEPPAPVIESVTLTGTSRELLTLQFEAVPDTTYTVQSRPVSGGSWSRVSDIPAGPARSVVVTDPITNGSEGRLYRVVTPGL